jgi:prepilin-type N-terminal cleavage/methylation domain-containing protein/prepilin-type processing-associated H-X9-DG protein
MRVLASRKGFSLVELLTVIAIIAILASIIFPVMGMVKNRANMNKCITQLHQIGLGLQMFKTDNRRYPDILATTVQHAGGVPGGAVIPFDQAGQNPDPNAPLGLFPEYVKTARLFHCPCSKELDTSAWNACKGVYFYKYDSYDYLILPSGMIGQHYNRDWATITGTQTAAQAADAAIAPDTAGNPKATGDATNDYERQLKFRTPPDTTVVTWCSNHAKIAGTTFTGRSPVLYLDGHVDQMPAQTVEKFQYRLLPKKE